MNEAAQPRQWTIKTSRLTRIVMAVLWGVLVTPSVAREPGPVLFVGNSLTYVGNLPAVFDSIEHDGHRRPESDMLVAAGATLTERWNDGSVAKALSTKTYGVVVLQERGGDFACGFGPEVCASSRRSLDQLARLIRAHGAAPILLGTYQGDREAAAMIETAEARAAEKANVDYVPIATLLTNLRSRHPRLAWLASDGMHPGQDLTLLAALLLFKKIHGTLPSESSISVRAPIFATKAPPLEVRAASSATGATGVHNGIEYDAGRVAILLKSIR